MSLEPERPIEKLLRACAKDRRDHAGEAWELHPVNRRLLQKEIERKFNPKSEPKKGLIGWLAEYWWLKALGGLAALAVVALAIWLAFPASPRNSNLLMARNELTPLSRASGAVKLAEDDKSVARNSILPEEREIAEQPLSAKKSVTRTEDMVDNLRRDFAGKDAGVNSSPALEQRVPQSLGLEQKTRKESATVAVSPANPPGAEAAASSAFRARYGSSSQRAPQAPVPVTADSADLEKQQVTASLPTLAGAPSGQVANPSSTVNASGLAADEPVNGPSNQIVRYGYFASTQRLGRPMRSFQQAGQNQSVAPSAKAGTLVNPAPASAPVLAYFHVEQSGTELRVIDSDGSVYVGQLKLQGTARAIPAPGLQRAETATALSAAPRLDEAAKSLGLSAGRQQNVFPGYVFQVVGTNITSSQRVVFSGTLTGVTNAGIATRAPVPGGFGGVAGPGSSSLQAQFSDAASYDQSKQNTSISGTALVGPDRLINIEALPAPAKPPAQ